ncbi:MAG: T9SS type A sorting domain-containing protein [FCB group bacterium]
MKLKIVLIIILTLAAMQGNAQPKPQDSTDLIWSNEIKDQGMGFYMVKFSITDSLIAAHGYTQDLFIDAKTGQEIHRIDGNNEVFFINNDSNFIRLNQARTKFEIFDAKTYLVIDSLENDGKILGNAKVSKDGNYFVSVADAGFRILDLKTKKILRTKNLFKPEANLTNFTLPTIAIVCNNTGILVTIVKTYLVSSSPPQYDEKYNQCIYDFNTLDSINAFEDKDISILSHNCSLIAFAGLDATNGVEVYNFTTKQLLWKLAINGPSLTGIEFSPDDKYLVTSNGVPANLLNIWDMSTGIQSYHYPYGGSFQNINISHDGKKIITSIAYYLYLLSANYNGTPVHENPDLIKQTIYPNPTTGEVNLQLVLQEPSITNIILTDINGNQIQYLFNKFLQSGEQNIDLDVSQIGSGTYFIKVQNPHLSLVFKLIITK